MKWFKHFSDALDDPFIQELIDEFGPSGYLAWFGLIEIIAKENGNKLTGKLEVKPSFLKRKLRISVKKLKEIYRFCSGEVGQNLDKTSAKPKLLFNFQKEKWVFELTKMLELKDNYIKDLQATSKKPSIEEEEEEEEEITNAGNVKKLAFERWWNITPKRNGRRVGKKEASTLFRVIPISDYKDLNRATLNYSSNETIRDPCRFLKNDYWKDFISDIDSVQGEKEIFKSEKTSEEDEQKQIEINKQNSQRLVNANL